MPTLNHIVAIAVASQVRTNVRPNLSSTVDQVEYGWPKVLFTIVLVIHTVGCICMGLVTSRIEIHLLDQSEQAILFSYIILNVGYIGIGWFARFKNDIPLLIASCIVMFTILVLCFMASYFFHSDLIPKYFGEHVWPSDADGLDAGIVVIDFFLTYNFIQKIKSMKYHGDQNDEEVF